MGKKTNTYELQGAILQAENEFARKIQEDWLEFQKALRVAFLSYEAKLKKPAPAKG